jgi:hypothetical protein
MTTTSSISIVPASIRFKIRLNIGKSDSILCPFDHCDPIVQDNRYDALTGKRGLNPVCAAAVARQDRLTASAVAAG